MISFFIKESSNFFKTYYWIINSDRLTFLDFVSNVEGSILGNNLRATGSKNSINGTTRKTRKGTKRKRSAHIRRN